MLDLFCFLEPKIYEANKFFKNALKQANIYNINRALTLQQFSYQYLFQNLRNFRLYLSENCDQKQIQKYFSTLIAADNVTTFNLKKFCLKTKASFEKICAEKQINLFLMILIENGDTLVTTSKGALRTILYNYIFSIINIAKQGYIGISVQLSSHNKLSTIKFIINDSQKYHGVAEPNISKLVTQIIN